MKNHPAVVRWIFGALALFGLAGCYWYSAKNYARRDAAENGLRSCERLAAEISRIRQTPQKARMTTRSTDDLGSVVEKAAADAQLGRDRVLRIDPQPAKRIGKSDYLDQATEVELLSVSLRQLIGFLFNVANSESELGISTLRLQVPHGSSQTASNELWLADIVLTQRIYAPTTPHR